jgi:hypothetical protein
MSPSELELYIQQDPAVPLRLTLSSGDQIVIRDEDRPIVEGLVLILCGAETGRFAQRHRLVSVPNIALVEPAPGNRPTGRRRRS